MYMARALIGNIKRFCMRYELADKETMMRATTDDAHFWDRSARKYATDPIKDLEGYERTAERTKDLLGRHATVLEIGCGTGTTALRLAPSVMRIIATDVSREMIAIARERAVAQACQNADFSVAATDRAPGSDGTYDAVLAFNILHLIADRPTTLGHVVRLLKPGGLLISKTPCLSEMNPLIRLAVPVARLLGKAPTVSVFSASELEADIAGAGLTIIERGRHGSRRKDPRIFIVASKS
jgi:ubiquinone/menaquinone biosynthesis C-methylase UbiE